jgi:hypothetical protein
MQFDPYATSAPPVSLPLSTVTTTTNNNALLLDYHNHHQQQQEMPSVAPSANAPSQPNTAADYPRRFSSSGSIASSSGASHSTSHSKSAGGGTYSILTDKNIAPPPKVPQSLQAIRSRVHPAELATLPPFDLVQHSGECLARLSLKSIIIKKWRPTFWISFGDSQLLFFRSKNDFEEWISNPYLKEEQRTKLIKFSIDFANDVYQGIVQGYSVSTLSAKEYSRDGYMYHFKLEKWDQYGPSIHIAMGGKSEHEVRNLRSIMKAMIEVSSPQDLNYIPSGGVGEASSYHSDYSTASGGGASSSVHSTRSHGSATYYGHQETAMMRGRRGGGAEEGMEQRATVFSSSGLRGILRSKSREPPASAQGQHQQYQYNDGMSSPTSSSSSALGATKSILKKVFQRKESGMEAAISSEYYNGAGYTSNMMNGQHAQKQQDYRYRPAEIDYGM